MSDFSTTTTVKARKQHVCCECGIAIEPGDEYERAFGVWDGHPDTFRTCVDCVRARRTMIEATRRAYAPWVTPYDEYEFYYGGLHEELPNAWQDTGALSVGRELVLARRRSRAAALAGEEQT